MRWLPLLTTLFTINAHATDGKQVGSYVSYIEGLACVEFQHTMDLLNAYKKSEAEGDKLLDLYEDGRCERFSFEGYVISRAHTELWVDLEQRKLYELNIYQIHFINVPGEEVGYAIMEVDLSESN
ncbi:hypothetical protein KW798_01015 [Candidatus Parcubacteria bacterium]|nr:hypothetical protein [Candidatus Parcubacteria bacterium]